MLSVQSAGCAGMERLGVPIRSTINSPTEDRHITRKMRMDAIHAHDLLVRDAAAILGDRQVRSQNKNYNNCDANDGAGNCCGGDNSGNNECSCINIKYNYNGMDKKNNGLLNGEENHTYNSRNIINNSNNNSNSNKRNKKYPQDFSSTEDCDQINLQQPQQQQQKQQTKIRCPHHVPLPDSEWGQDRDLQIRTRYQTSEITRSYIKAPPNKTVLDVPDQRSNFNHNSGNNLSNHQDIPHHNNQQIHQQTIKNNKPNVIQKFFSRKIHSGHYNSNLYNTNQNQAQKQQHQQQQQQLCPSTSTSLSSASSSTSIALPISSSAITSTNCNYGTTQNQSINEKYHHDNNSNIDSIQNDSQQNLLTIPVKQNKQQQQLSPSSSSILNKKLLKTTNKLPTASTSTSIDCNYYQATSNIINYDNNLQSNIIKSSTSLTSLSSLSSDISKKGSTTNLIKSDDKNYI